MVVNEGNKVYVRDSQGGWERGTLVDIKTHTRFNEDSVSGESERRSIIVLVMMDGDEGGTPREVEVSEKDVKEYGGIGLPMSGSEEGAEDECGVDDMSRLEQLHEASIMYNLRKRFNAKQPYTLISNIVVAVNPYEWREELYGAGVMARHFVCESENTTRSSPEVIEEKKVGWSPHVYSVSAAAYSGLIKTGHNQTILVSGESGSGKTETCRLLLNHLACLAGEERLPGARRNSLTRNAEAIIRSTPLLESFGNARTTRNDNSSRFGKYMQLQFRASRLVGSRVSTYLLEKSRVVRHGPGERTFHVFYELMSAPLKVLQQLSLTSETSVRELHYLNMGGRGGGGESSDFLKTSAALKLIGVADPMHVWEVVAAVAMLGDISFVGSDSDVSCTPAASSDLATPAKLLGLNAEELSWQLTHRAVKVSGDTIDVPLSCDAAVEARDGMAKEVYQKVFEMLVNMVNIKCSANTPTEELGYVSLLDIFGFECFGENNFEQFCINYANEKLQQTFTQDVLKLSQIEYEAEEIGWHHIEFEDNAPILEMLEAPKTGILSLLDEECNIPRGTVRGFANKTIHSFKGLQLQVPQRRRGVPSSDNSFTIMHYAGDVTYETVGWLDKNRDVFREDMLGLLCRSENSVVFSAFNVPPIMTSPNKSKRKGGLMHETVGSKFRRQLQSLTSELGCTHLQYVRCIKPNDYKSPDDFSGGMVAHQLRCAGLVAAVKVARSAFPSRIPHQDFLSRFSILCSKEFCQNLAKLSSSRDRCSLIMKYLLDSDDCSLYAIGKSIVYLGPKAVQRLEQRRESLRAERGALVASVVSTVIMRKRFLLLRSAVITIQSFARANRAKRRIRKIRVKKLASQKEAKVPLKTGKSSGNSSITVRASQDAGGSVELLDERRNNNDENVLSTGADHPTSILRKGPQKKGTRKKMNLCLDITEVDTNNVPVAENGDMNNMHLSLPSNKGTAVPSKFKPSSPRKTRKEHFMHLNEAHVNEALQLNRIGFVLSAFPSSAGTLKCRVYRERGVLRGRDIYRLYTDPMGKSMEQFLLAAKRLPSSVVRGAYYSMYSKGNIGEQQHAPRAKSVHLGEVRAKSRYNTEFEVFQTTSGTRQELAAINYPTAGSFEALESDRNKVTKPKENEPIDTPRMVEVALPCIETELDCRSDNGTTKTNHHDAEEISLMKYLKSGGMSNDNSSNRFEEQRQPFLLQNRQPRWSPQNRRYVLNFQGRVKMTSVKNFQLVCQGDTDEKIRLQFGRASRDEFTLDFSWPLSPVQALAIAITSFDCS